MSSTTSNGLRGSWTPYVVSGSLLMLAACGGAADLGSGNAGLSSCGGTHRGDVWIRSPADLARLRDVETIEGDLKIASADDRALSITSGELPCLQHVTGSLLIGGEGRATAGAFELSALVRVDGGVAVGLLSDTEESPGSVSLPSLTVVGTAEDSASPGVQIGEAQLSGGVSAPKLRTVYGPVSIALITPSIDLRSLHTVAGSVTFGPGEKLEDFRLDGLREVAGKITFQQLGALPFSRVDAWLSALSADATRVVAIGCARADGDGSPDCS